MFLKLFGFLHYNKLQLNAKCLISDSGAISEETSIPSFHAITIRDAIERPEALSFGGMVVTGLGAGKVMAGISEALDSAGRSEAGRQERYS